jgi:hypothetical protein
MRIFLVPEGDTGVVIGVAGGCRAVAVAVLVLDLDFERLLEAHRVGNVPAIHPVVALSIWR